MRTKPPALREPFDRSLYVAAAVVTFSPLLCAEPSLRLVPGLLPLLLLLAAAGIPLSLRWRRGGVARETAGRLAGVAGAGSGLAALVYELQVLELFQHSRMLDATVDSQVMALVACGIGWIIAFHTFTLLNDTEILMSVGFGLSLFVVATLIQPQARTLVFLAPFTIATLFILLRHRRGQVRRRADEVVGRPPAEGWRQDAQTLAGVGGGVLVLSFVVGLLLANYTLPSTLLEQTGGNLVRRLANWMLQSQLGGQHGDFVTMEVGTALGADSPNVVMRVRATAPTLWRGNVYSRYDGRNWFSESRDRPALGTRLKELTEVLDPRPVPPPYVRRYQFEVVRPGPLVYTVTGARELRVRAAALQVNRAGRVLARPGLDPGDQYEVVAPVPGYLSDTPEELPPGELERCLQLPARLPQRVVDLAQRVVGDAPSAELRMQRLMDYLVAEKLYTLRPDPVPAGRDTVDYFLFQSDAGWCRHFAAALAVMARATGVPTRVVDGFAEGEGGVEEGLYVVRERDAHAWVEAWLPDHGWAVYDAAGLATEQLTGLALLVSTTRTALQALGKRLKAAAPYGLPPLGVAGLGYLVWRFELLRPRRRRPATPPDTLTDRWRRRLARAVAGLDLERRPHETDLRYAARAAIRLPDAAAALARLGAEIDQARFGGQPVSEAAVAAVEDALAAVAAASRKARRRR